MPRRIPATIFALALLVALATSSSSLGAEPKKKIAPVPLPLLPVVQEWIATLDDAPTAGGAMDDERVYIPIQPGRIVALSRVSGEKVWTRDVESSWPPIVVNDAIYVVASDEIHALDASTGAERWRVPYERTLAAPLTAAGSSLIGMFEPGVAMAFAITDGRPLWTRELPSSSHFPAALDAERAIFALNDSRLVALRLDDGAVDWEQKLDGVLNQPSVAHDRVFVGSNLNALYAIRNDNGRIAWKWKAGGDVIGTSGDSKGGAYYASLDNVLRAVNRGNGNQRWIKEIPTRPLLPPQTFGDGMKYEEIVIILGVTSEIDAFAAKNGAMVGTYMPPPEAALEGPPLVDPVLQPYRVAMVVITRDGRALGLKPSAMLLQEPTNTPWTTELPGRKLDRERLTAPARR